MTNYQQMNGLSYHHGFLWVSLWVSGRVPAQGRTTLPRNKRSVLSTMANRKGRLNFICRVFGRAVLAEKTAPVAAAATVPVSSTSTKDLCIICRQTVGLGCGDAS